MQNRLAVAGKKDVEIERQERAHALAQAREIMELFKRLNAEGRVRVQARVTFVPAGGEPKTKTRRITLSKTR